MPDESINSLAPPAISLLTIGCFSTLYGSWVNYPKEYDEIGLFLSDLFLDAAPFGFGTMAFQWFYLKNMKIFSWVISILPIMVILVAAVILVLLRLHLEKSGYPAKITSPAKLSNQAKKKIQNKVNSIKLSTSSLLIK